MTNLPTMVTVEVPVPTPDPVPEFPRFVDIAYECPMWNNAYTMIESRIPERLLIRVGSKNSVNIFWGRLGEITYMSPRQYWKKIGRRVKKLEQTVGLLIGPSIMNGFRGLPLNQATIQSMEAVLYNRDQWLEHMGHPTYADAIKHCLGVQPIRSRSN